MFSFDFTQETGLKNIEYTYAEAIWGILLADKLNFLQNWFDFLKSKDVKIVKRDMWDMFYQLVLSCNGDINNFEDDGSWPSYIDEYLEYRQEGNQ